MHSCTMGFHFQSMGYQDHDDQVHVHGQDVNSLHNSMDTRSEACFSNDWW